MVREVSVDYVETNCGFKRGWQFSIGPEKLVDLFFETTNWETKDGLDPYEYLEDIQNNSLPPGLVSVESLDNERFFRIACGKSSVETARTFASTLFPD